MNNACFVWANATFVIKVLSILVCVYGTMSVMGFFTWLFGDEYHIVVNAKKMTIVTAILFMAHSGVLIVSPSLDDMRSLVGTLCNL